MTLWHWGVFCGLILILLTLDLGFFHRASRPSRIKESLLLSAAWISAALLFALTLYFKRGRSESLTFVTAYLVEFSLSLDNVVAISLVFTLFGVAAEQQPRILFWGVLGVLFMRGLMIGLGAALLHSFQWILYPMGIFLVLTGIRWIFVQPNALPPENNIVIRIARKIFPVTASMDGGKFFIRQNGRLALTPLALVLIAVETTDLVFAMDSIPTVFAVTQNAFIVFSSNIFAVLGLRSLYFVLARALGRFRYLKTGLAILLIFAGIKMLMRRWLEISMEISLAIIILIISLSLLLSTRSKPARA